MFDQMMFLYRPVSDVNADTKMLLFDSWYDQYRGVVAHMAVINGAVKKGASIHMFGCMKITLRLCL